MNLTNTSILSGKEHTLVLPLTEEEFIECYTKWQNGKLVNDAFPMLSPLEREFILLGVTEKEWEELICTKNVML